MYEFIANNYSTILVVAIAVAIALIILCVIAKLFRIAIGLGILFVVIPIVFTIFWGDGFEYVSKFASFFQPAYQQQIEDAYEYYKKKDAEDPFVDYDAVSNAVTNFFQDYFSEAQNQIKMPSYIKPVDSSIDLEASILPSQSPTGLATFFCPLIFL